VSATRAAKVVPACTLDLAKKRPDTQRHRFVEGSLAADSLRASLGPSQQERTQAKEHGLHASRRWRHPHLGGTAQWCQRRIHHALAAGRVGALQRALQRRRESLRLADAHR
jgi:hypothetical protein